MTILGVNGQFLGKCSLIVGERSIFVGQVLTTILSSNFHQAPSVVGSRRRVGGKRRQQISRQGSRTSQRSQSSQGSKLSSGRQQQGERIPAPQNPVQTNPPQTSLTRINTPKFVSRSEGDLVAEVFSADEAPPLPIPRPRLPAPRTNRPSSRPRPSSAGRPNPRPATLGSRPLRQQSNRATTRQETGSGQTSFSNKSKSIASSAGRSKTTSSRTKGMIQAPEISIMTWLFRC